MLVRARGFFFGFRRRGRRFGYRHRQFGVRQRLMCLVVDALRETVSLFLGLFFISIEEDKLHLSPPRSSISSSSAQFVAVELWATIIGSHTLPGKAIERCCPRNLVKDAPHSKSHGASKHGNKGGHYDPQVHAWYQLNQDIGIKGYDILGKILNIRVIINDGLEVTFIRHNASLDDYGPIVGIDLKIPPRPPSVAFVEFEDERDAEDAVRGRDGYDFDGNRLQVSDLIFIRKHQRKEAYR
ncbi:hypothetical protein Dimus_008114 [Dionaea muscipula]